MRSVPAVLATLLLSGCASWFAAAPACERPDEVLADVAGDVLTCEQAAPVEDYVEVLAARPLGSTDRGLLYAALRGAFTRDAAGTREAIAKSSAVVAEVTDLTGVPAAEWRASRGWEAVSGHGPWPGDGDLGNLTARAMSVWAHDDEERLVLTETDIEGFIRFASLCREVQGGGAMRLSVADRVTVYRTVTERFDAADRDDQLGIVALGALWGAARDAWKAAPFERQQAWIQTAPLPPPMTATSLGYLEAVLDAGPARHARALTGVFPDLHLEPAP